MYHTAQKPCEFQFFSLKKNFWLTLLQNAKYYHIKPQQNLEFLGKLDGGAKSTWIGRNFCFDSTRTISILKFEQFPA